MRKKMLAALLTLGLSAALIVGCGGSGSETTSTDAAGGEKETITIAATAAPHAEILEEAKKILDEQGYDLQITVFDDYVQPNLKVESGEFDANYFQHIPYLESFNEENGTHLVNAGGIHYEPFGIGSCTDDVAIMH